MLVKFKLTLEEDMIVIQMNKPIHRRKRIKPILHFKILLVLIESKI